MPVAKLIYRLPEEREEHAAAMAGVGALAAIGAVLEHIRQRLKYGDLPPGAMAELEGVRRVLLDEAAEHRLPIE